MPNPFTGLSPRTPLGASGLGAVGGARGAGAGALRYLVEFVIASNAQDLDQLAAKLDEVSKAQEANQDKINELEAKRENLGSRIAKVQEIQKANLSGVRGEIAKIHASELKIAHLQDEKDKLQKNDIAGRKAINTQIATERKAIDGIKADLLQTNVIGKRQLNDLINVNQLKKEQKELTGQLSALQQEQNALERQHNEILTQGDKIVTNRQLLLPRLGALALGVVGGVVGAFAIQPLIDGLSNALDGLGKGLQDVVDPAHNARDAMDDFSKSVDGAVGDDDVSRVQAIKKLLEDLPTAAADRLDPSKLFQADVAARLAEVNKNFKTYIDLQQHSNQLSEEQRKELAKQLILADAANGSLRTQVVQTGALFHGAEEYSTILGQQKLLLGDSADQALNALKDQNGAVIDLDYYWGLVNNAIVDVAGNTGNATDQAAQLAEEAQRARDAFEAVRLDNLTSDIQAASQQTIDFITRTRDSVIDAANEAADVAIEGIRNRTEKAIDGIRARSDARIEQLQNKLSSLQLTPSNRTKSLEAQLKALDDSGPSRRTRELAAAIDRLNEAEKRRQYQQSLNDAQEDKHLLILQHQLETTKKQIDLSRYQGKERVIAIEAEIARIQKQADVQNLLNERLDLQYRLSQKMQRQQGETIQDFIERRAQESRDIISQSAELDRTERIDRLEKLRDATQYEIDLAQKNADIKEIIRQHDLEQHLEALQKALDASQDRDKRELESRKESLQKQLDASKEADQAALDAKKKAIQHEIDAERDRSQRLIESAQKTAEAQIKTVESTRDHIVDAANKTADLAIDAERRRADTAIKLMQQNQDDQLMLAMAGAKSQAELADIAGHLVGFQFTDAQLEAMLQTYGFSNYQIAQEIARADWWRTYYQQQLNRINTTVGPTNPPWTSHAKGGVFELSNAMNFGRDFRVGDGGGGKELGIVLSNQVYKALKDSGDSGPLVGEFNYYGNGHPRDDRFYIEQIFDDLLRKRLR